MVMNQLAMHFMHVTSGVGTIYVSARVRAFFRIFGSTGRIVQKCGVLLDPLAVRLTHAKWMIFRSAQVQLNIRLKAHLLASAHLSPKRRLTVVLHLVLLYLTISNINSKVQ